MNNRFNSEDKIILAIDGLDLSQAKLLLGKCPNIKWVKAVSYTHLTLPTTSTV